MHLLDQWAHARPWGTDVYVHVQCKTCGAEQQHSSTCLAGEVCEVAWECVCGRTDWVRVDVARALERGEQRPVEPAVIEEVR
jgi:hypothetical protein